MSGLFSSITTAVKGINANQTSLQTTAHNISNMNTKGFHRQRVELKADTPHHVPGIGQLGTGVKIDSVVRMVDNFVDLQLRKENTVLNEYTVKSEVMGQIESFFHEPSDTGLHFAMGEMFNSWQELAKTPESLNAKNMVVEKAKTFTDTLNHMTRQITEVKTEIGVNLDKSIQDFNSLVEQLDSVNHQIFKSVTKGQNPNDLQDQRDVILEQMSGLAPIKETYDASGRAEVRVDGQLVTEGEGTKTLSSIRSITKNEDGTYTAQVNVGGASSTDKEMVLEESLGEGLHAGSLVFYQEGKGGETVTPANITSGKMGGFRSAIKETDQRLSELKDFAKGTAKLFNQVHREGVNKNDFFTWTEGEDGNGLQVNEAILKDSSLVETKKSGESSEGDGSRALAMAQLRLARIDFRAGADAGYNQDTMSFKANPSGQTMEGSYGDVVTKVGISTQKSTNMAENQEALMGQLMDRRESISGVSLDEEVTNLMKFQRSYEANSRVLSTINEMLDTLINRTGV